MHAPHLGLEPTVARHRERPNALVRRRLARRRAVLFRDKSQASLSKAGGRQSVRRRAGERSADVIVLDGGSANEDESSNIPQAQSPTCSTRCRRSVALSLRIPAGFLNPPGQENCTFQSGL